LLSGDIWGQLLIQFLLILLNAFFASTEIALLALNENKLARAAEEGDKKAAKLLKILESPTGFLSTIQIGITLAGFLGSAFAADAFASLLTGWLKASVFPGASLSLLNTLSVIVITLILSYFTLVLGELVPKRIAMKNPEKVARFSCGTVYFLSKIFKPITWFLSVSTNGVLRLFGIDPHEDPEEVSEAEIRLMVDIGEEKGAIESTEKEMIENIFEFNNMTAEDIMIHRTDMEVIWLDDAHEEIVRRIEETGLSRFPVCNEDADDIVGLLSTREYLLNAQSEEPKPLVEILRTAYFVPESVHTDVLFRNMQAQKIHMAIVVDEYGGTSGLITMEDLLERIVGNIYDEFDPQEEHDIYHLSENFWRIAGGAELEEIVKELGVTLPEDEEYDTLGGLIMDSLEEIPDEDEKPIIETHGLRIEILEIKDRRIEWALVSLLPPPAEDELGA
jgi:putative hemolysin